MSAGYESKIKALGCFIESKNQLIEGKGSKQFCKLITTLCETTECVYFFYTKVTPKEYNV